MLTGLGDESSHLLARSPGDEAEVGDFAYFALAARYLLLHDLPVLAAGENVATHRCDLEAQEPLGVCPLVAA